MRLFQATLSQTALWCYKFWTLTAAQKRHLRAVQGNMLRCFAGPRSQTDEDYLTWDRRATKEADKNTRNAGVDYWRRQYLHKKFACAGRLTNMDEERLAKRATQWMDSDWWKHQPRGASAYGSRPMQARLGSILRCEDDLRKFAESLAWESWQSKARSADTDWVDFA